MTRASRFTMALGVAFLATAIEVATACGTSGSAPESAASGGVVPVDAATDAGNPLDAMMGADAISAGPHASVRVADFAKPLLLDLDFCFSTDPLSATTNWVGPMMRGTYGYIQNSTISSYVDVPVDTKSVRFVLSDSPDCTQTLDGIPDFALDTPLAEGSRSTLLFAGTGYDAGTRMLQVIELADISAPADAGNSVRFVNGAQAESAIDIYAYSGFGMKAPCTLLYDNVAFGSVGVAASLPGDGGPTAANGYAPLEGQNLYNLTFSMLGYVVHGASCDDTFGSLYSTDGFLGTGAWTIFIADEQPTHTMCRDDGTADPLCVKN